MADVKFSELTSLAATDVASADVLAIVDTDAATSKKLTIDNLFGSIPVNILQTDNTEATSSVGAVRTAGGVSMARKLFVGTTSTLTGAVTATAGVFPAAQDGAPLGSSSLQFSDIFLADGAVAAFGDDGEVTLTHVHDTGLLLSDASGVGVTKLMFGDAACFVQQSTDGQLDIDADAELEITSPIVDINASTGIALDGAKLTSNWLVSSTNQIQFYDAAIYINSSTDGQLDIVADAEVQIAATAIDINGTVDMSGLVTVQTGIVPNAQDGAYLGTSSLQFSDLFLADAAVVAFGDDGEVTLTHVHDSGLLLSDASGVGVTKLMFGDAATYIHQSADTHLDLVADGDITLKATDIKVGLASQDGNIQSLTNAFDMTLKQFDGQEVARIFDGGKALTDTDAATVKSGFGHRRPVIFIDASSSSKAVTLTDSESGSLIKVNNGSGSYAAAVTLPALGANGEGVFFEFVMEVNNASAFTIQAAEGASVIHAYSMTVATAGSDIGGGDVMTIAANATKGTFIRCTAVVGSGTASAVLWLAEVYQPAGTAVAVA
jgi:hypothetical protein|tara:strand:- start:1077 stop:2720 length:1644 start_codon:yes stop_codon:yes gene_type:complete